jgi:dTMP kinase
VRIFALESRSVAPSILHRFVVLEGLDGAGTTTQMRLLCDRLAREGRACTGTFEPTDGPVGALIRSILARRAEALPLTVAMLFAADRHEHVAGPGGIVERAGRGELVVSDRYLFSSLAYQSIECGFERVLAFNEDFPLPELLVFLDTPVAVSQARLGRRTHRELYDGAAFQARVREGYLRAIEHFEGIGMRVLTLDGERPAEEIHEAIWTETARLPIHKV